MPKLNSSVQFPKHCGFEPHQKEAIKILSGHKFISNEGHSVNFSFVDGKWMAVVQEKLPAVFTNQVQLPVYVESGIIMENFVDTEPNFAKQYIHITFNKAIEDKKGFVYVGCNGLRGGGDSVSYVEGIDISHNQGDIDWNLLTPSSSGKKFVVCKGSEGATYQDPKLEEYIRGLLSSGFDKGVYHFLRFGTSTAKAQMDNFIAQLRKAGGWYDSAIIALDVEKEENTHLISSVTEECVMYLEEQNIHPYIYTTQNFWNRYVPNTPEIVKECRLWIARYRNVEPSPQELPRGWDKWTIWQYSEQGSVPGIGGFVDLNKMKING